MFEHNWNYLLKLKYKWVYFYLVNRATSFLRALGLGWWHLFFKIKPWWTSYLTSNFYILCWLGFYKVSQQFPNWLQRLGGCNGQVPWPTNLVVPWKWLVPWNLVGPLKILPKVPMLTAGLFSTFTCCGRNIPSWAYLYLRLFLKRKGDLDLLTWQAHLNKWSFS